MNRCKLPTTLYIALGDYSAALKKPAPCMGSMDPVESMDDAADMLLQVESDTGRDGRVFELTFDVSSNAFESAREVTEDCVGLIVARRFDRGLEAAE